MTHFSLKKETCDKPVRMVIVNRSIERIETLRQMFNAKVPGLEFQYHCQHDPTAE